MYVDELLDRLPLRQFVRPAGEASLALAERGLLHWLSRPAEFQIVRCGEGAQILAAHEPALQEAGALLREAYGDCVTFGRALVHTWICPREGRLMEPVMHLRVEASRPHVLAVLDELKQRNADVQAVELGYDRAVARGEIRLADLLGLQDAVERRTGERPHVRSRLEGYRAAPAEAMARGGSWHGGEGGRAVRA